MAFESITVTQPPPPLEGRVLHIDRYGVDFTAIEPPSGSREIGHIEARGATHPVPAVVVRKGTL